MVDKLQARVKHLEGLIRQSGIVEASSEEQQQQIILTKELTTTADISPSNHHHPSRRAPSGYYGQHTVFKFFTEVNYVRPAVRTYGFIKTYIAGADCDWKIPSLFNFIDEVVHEKLEPAGFRPRKRKEKARYDVQGEESLFALLPSKEDTDGLVSIYLDQFEHLHRVVHLPTFQRAYASFWTTATATPPSSAMAVLVLSMAAVATGASTSVESKYSGMVQGWIDVCESWLKQQSHKHRKLEYYQGLCIIYLAKRIDMTHKKRFWIETGSLIQSAMIDGLHFEPTLRTTAESPFAQEMKRRIWHTIRELELQNSYEYGLPTLLHNIDSDVAGTTNVPDDTISETMAQAPVSEPMDKFTRTSYQYLSACSWELRLDISRRLFSPGCCSSPLSYQEVITFTERVNQALHDLPDWRVGPFMATNQRTRREHTLVSTLLRLQLKECILALHRPQLQHDSIRSGLSESICYQVSRDILLMHRELADMGMHCLSQLREDLLLASLTLTRLTLMQPSGTSFASGNVLPDPYFTLRVIQSNRLAPQDHPALYWQIRP